MTKPIIAVICGVLLAPLFAVAAPSKHAETRPTEELEKDIEKEPNAGHLIHGLRKKARKGDKKAAGILEKSFLKATDKDAKRTIALALVQSGNRDDKYWQEIAKPVEERLNGDIPLPLAFDSNGKAVRGKFGDEYLAWCKAHDVKPESMVDEAMYRAQNDVRTLAMASDSRAIPLLMRALDSKNHLVVVRAAEGLAKLQHAPAIDKIIDACRRLPAESASAVAEYLVFFKNEKAQSAADKHVQKKRTLEKRRKQAETKDLKMLGEEY